MIGLVLKTNKKLSKDGPSCASSNKGVDVDSTHWHGGIGGWPDFERKGGDIEFSLLLCWGWGSLERCQIKIRI